MPEPGTRPCSSPSSKSFAPSGTPNHWSRSPASNRQPSVYKTDARPLVLERHSLFACSSKVPIVYIVCGFSALCAEKPHTNKRNSSLSAIPSLPCKRKKLVGAARFERATTALQTRDAARLHHAPIKKPLRQGACAARPGAAAGSPRVLRSDQWVFLLRTIPRQPCGPGRAQRFQAWAAAGGIGGFLQHHRPLVCLVLWRPRWPPLVHCRDYIMVIKGCQEVRID